MAKVDLKLCKNTKCSETYFFQIANKDILSTSYNLDSFTQIVEGQKTILKYMNRKVRIGWETQQQRP